MRVPPPLAALAAVVAQRAVSGPRPTPTVARSAAAAIVAVSSVTMAATTVHQFRRRGTTVEPFRPEEASFLVTTGANAITRNPMYVGLAGVLVANAIRRGSWVALFPVAGFIVFIDRLQIAAEEPALLDLFGVEYEAYRAATPRWLDRRSLDITNS